MNDLQYRRRLLEAPLKEALATFPVVVLIGARQTGKTTLAQHSPDAGDRVFRTLDDLRVLQMAQDSPDALVAEAERLVIDEVQRVPDLLRALKRAVDQNRRAGRFLLTGSANLLLLNGVSETLAGRVVYLRLGPLTELEKRGLPSDPIWSRWLTAESAADALAQTPRRPAAWDWSQAAKTGGYPPVLGLTDTARTRWFEGYVTTYIERDLQQLSNISALADFRRFVELTADRTGGLINRAELAVDATISRPTAHRWLNLLETSFLVRLLQPYARSRSKRLIKSPKLYWTDTGLAAHLFGFASAAELRTAPRSGQFLENLLLADLDAWRETETPRPQIFFWRTAEGHEIDFVIEHRRRLLPIEVKAGPKLRFEQFKSLDLFLDHYPSARYGLVLYGGQEAYLVTPRILAAPLSVMAHGGRSLP